MDKYDTNRSGVPTNVEGLVGASGNDGLREGATRQNIDPEELRRRQGLTLVHSSAQREHFLLDWGCS